MQVLMISRSVYEWDIRVRREARALVAAGHDVMFLGLPSTTSSDGAIDLIDVGRRPSPTGVSFNRPSIAYRLARWLLLPEHRWWDEKRFQRQVIESVHRLGLEPDVIHAHDFPALVPAFTLADRLGSHLVYDSHEIWAGRPRRGRPEPVRRARQLRREAALAREADAVIMVSDHGAEHLCDSLGLEQVHVVRNTFPTLADVIVPDSPSGAVYAGRIAPRRDLDTVLAASVWQDRSFELHMMGEVDDVELPPWVRAHPKGTMDEVNDLLAEVGIGLVTMTDKYLNHRVALPNKLFQAISVGVPVVATDVPQTAEVVAAHDLGELYRAGDPESFADALERARSRYKELIGNVREAQPKFDWSVDSERLHHIYSTLESRR